MLPIDLHDYLMSHIAYNPAWSSLQNFCDVDHILVWGKCRQMTICALLNFFFRLTDSWNIKDMDRERVT